MITIENLTFSYAGSSAIFADFDWQVERGETWAIIGPSGCGKSTLLYLLAGLRLPAQGSITIHEDVIFGRYMDPAASPENMEAFAEAKGFEKCGLLPGIGARLAAETIIESLE